MFTAVSDLDYRDQFESQESEDRDETRVDSLLDELTDAAQDADGDSSLVAARDEAEKTARLAGASEYECSMAIGRGVRAARSEYKD